MFTSASGPASSAYSCKRFNSGFAGSRSFFGFIALTAAFCSCSCTMTAHSPYLTRETQVLPLLSDKGIKVSQDGTIPYQRWRVPHWAHKMAYVWLVGSHDFRKCDHADLIFYFHGMHSKDYYGDFRKELEESAAARRDKPFLFVGLVDTPFATEAETGKYRWSALVPKSGARPDRLVKIINRVFEGFAQQFPNIKKEKTKITLAGFSGGGRVLSSVGKWLAESPADDEHAKAFRKHLGKMLYFDCWFDPADLKSVPSLLVSNPSMKIVGTVHMDKPKKYAEIIAEKFKMKPVRRDEQSVGLGGRLVIYENKSHWEAMISRLKQALDV